MAFTVMLLRACGDDTSLVSGEWLRNEWELARSVQRQGDKEAILVIDEIQKVPDWSAVVKMLWDEDTRRKTPLKVVLTESSSLLIHKGMEESSVGRFEVLDSPHWSYSECKEAFGYSLDDFLFFGGYPGAVTLKMMKHVGRGVWACLLWSQRFRKTSS
jgi:predicted AAA+ superfamily ATPase